MKNKELLVEKYAEGEDYRIFATINGFCAITKKIPATIAGDGKSTIRQLINKKNKNRGKMAPYVKKIKKTKQLKEYLLMQKKSLETTPKKGQKIQLNPASNITAGGDCYDYTDQAHPEIKKIAMKILKAIPGLTYAGIDIITKDITKKPTKNNYTIIEINNEPGPGMHHYPLEGKSRNAAGALIELMFPNINKQEKNKS